MLILPDTNIWVHHLHQGDARLESYLRGASVVIHPMVIGELVCGSLRHRDAILSLLQILPKVEVASDETVLNFIDANRLYSKGLGWVDMHLLCATALTPHCRLWTQDRRLKAQAEQLNLHLDDCQ